MFWRLRQISLCKVTHREVLFRPRKDSQNGVISNPMAFEHSKPQSLTPSHHLGESPWDT